MTIRRNVRPLLALLAVAGCAEGGVWANVPNEPGPVAAACRQEIANDPRVRGLGAEAGGNAANTETVRQQLLVLLPQLYRQCMVRAGVIAPGQPLPTSRDTF
ncbi:phosphoribosylamine--glycine ligase [Roseomonas sp. CAU 1739]|uniref:phosphoribosylamine--glycine ligase n=1 Tax=Roseomonas sp. CAU 1739 TaxID=3140364 RepID=UPI00325BEAD3